MSAFSWLDYSEYERRRALDVIELFRDPSTLDELGIGTVRDAFADQLFPGTSTIQTRARYFLLIPWTYKALEERRVSSADIARRARNEELRLIDALVAGKQRNGVIGIQARKSLKRLPSNIYWAGLHSWGLRLFDGSQDQYHASLDRYHARRGRGVRNDDGEPMEVAAPPNWHPHIPPAPDDLTERATFDLRRIDADYLSDRIQTRFPGTLLAFLVDRAKRSRVAFAWEHELVPDAPAHAAELLDNARRFSQLMHGAALVYNLLLAEAQNNAERIDEYREAVGDWLEEADHRETVATWDLTRFWSLVLAAGSRVSPLSRSFIDGWIRLVRTEDATGSPGRKLVHARELEVKRGRARLVNRRALDLWNGAAGTAPLDFRWPVVRTIVNDIADGLRRDA